MNQSDRDAFDERLDDALCRRYRIPDPTPTLDVIHAANTRSSIKHRHRIAWRLAAGIVFALAGVWVVSYAMQQPSASNSSPYTPRTMVQAYHDAIATGFKPAWKCETDQQFMDTFQRKLGLPLLLADDSPEIEPVGLSYGNTLSRGTVHVLARVRGEPVVVFVDRIDRDAAQVTASNGLHLHRGQIDGLVLYELSPFPEPRLLDLFHIPDDTPEAKLTPSTHFDGPQQPLSPTFSIGGCNAMAGSQHSLEGGATASMTY